VALEEAVAGVRVVVVEHQEPVVVDVAADKAAYIKSDCFLHVKHVLHFYCKY
jgi:hypothetical protein